MDEQGQQLFMKRLVESQAEILALVRMLMPADPSDVADVAQDVNCALIAHRADYDPMRPFRPWLFSFVRMQVQRYRQRKGRERLVFDDELAASVAGAYVEVFPGGVAAGGTAALLRHLETCRAKLPAKYRDLIDKRYGQNRSLADIARETRANPHTVSTALGYIRGKLHDCITRLCRLEGGDEEPPALSNGEAEINRMLDGLSTPVPGDPARLPQLLRDADLMRCWVAESGLDALLRWEAGMNRAPAVPVRHWPWARLAVAAAALILLFGGMLWALTAHPSRSVAPIAAAEPSPGRSPVVNLVQEETPSVSAAAASAANAPIPESALAPAATNAVASKEERTVNVKTVAVMVAIAAAAVSPPVTLSTEFEVIFVDGFSNRDGLETRSFVEGFSNGRATWILSTIPPAGTIYRLF